MANKKEMVHAFETARKNFAVSLQKGNDYVIIGYNDDIKFEAGALLREYMEKGWKEVA